MRAPRKPVANGAPIGQRPHHLVTGAALGVHGKIQYVDLVCTCGAHQTEPFDANENVAVAISQTECLMCGCCRNMSRARVAS